MSHYTMKHRRRKTAAIAVVVIVLIVAALFGGYWVYDQLTGKNKYPLKYEELISAYADENGLDPYLVAAVIYVESGYDSQAVSRSGARGLMQIMPATGEWIAGKLKAEKFDEEKLFNPETNIQFGCWYLGFLKEKFDGNPQLMMAGYNAGHNRVAAWMDDDTVSDGQSLTNIPFEETDGYVKKVDKAYEKYKELYEIA